MKNKTIIPIKSSIILKKIFYLLRNKKVAKIINYNKELQKILGIGLYHYQILSKRIINYYDKEKGLEYDRIHGNLLYDGKFSHGIRNGKGIEYNYLHEIIFKGNFLNGKRNGKGIEFNNKGEIIYKGEYLNGERNGIGREFSYLNIYILEEEEDNKIILKKIENIVNRVITFIGLYKDGKRWNGFDFDFDQYGLLIHSGKYLNGKSLNEEENELKDNLKILKEEKSEISKEEKSENSDISDIKRYDYKGIPMSNELSYGRGKEYRGDNIIYEGEFKLGKRNGLGKEYFDKVLIFEGKYENGKRNGKGFEYWTNEELISETTFKDKYFNIENFSRLRFVGNYINGEKNGIGEEYDVYGNLIFKGEYLNDKRWKGKGIEYYNGDILFEGEYLDGQKWNGKGKEYFGDRLIFSGEYFKGKIWDGIIREYDEFGYLSFEGHYQNGNKNGIGKEYEEGILIYEGNYLYGEKSGGGIEYDEYKNIIYIGSYSEGKRNGFGTEYDYEENKIFKGIFYDDYKFNGQIFNFNNNLEYSGIIILNMKWEGKEYEGGKVINIKFGKRECQIKKKLISNNEI